MKTEMTGTVVDGGIRLDERVDLPNDSRVQVMLQPLSVPMTRWSTAMEAFKRLCREHPIDSGGLRYTREELHERH
jgi:hypothetical protein